MRNVAFLTTIFPTKNRFLLEFFNSLNIQDFVHFDIIVVNDGYNYLHNIKNKYPNLSILELPYSSTHAKNRQFGINFCISHGYDILVFGDCDDRFAKNRISKSVELLSSGDNDIVVNDLTTFNHSGIIDTKYLSNRIKNNTVINYNFIMDKNIFGLTNTALNITILEQVIFDESLVAVDWFLFKKLLKIGHKAIFTNETITYYRQHPTNLVGLDNRDGTYPFWWEDANMKADGY